MHRIPPVVVSLCRYSISRCFAIKSCSGKYHVLFPAFLYFFSRSHPYYFTKEHSPIQLYYFVKFTRTFRYSSMHINLQTDAYFSTHIKCLTFLQAFHQRKILLHTSCSPSRASFQALIGSLTFSEENPFKIVASWNILTFPTEPYTKNNFIACNLDACTEEITFISLSKLRVSAENTLGVLRTYFCLKQSASTSRINELYNTCALTNLGEFVYPITKSMKPFRTENGIFTAHCVFLWGIPSAPLLKKPMYSYNDNIWCERSMQRPETTNTGNWSQEASL